MEENGVKRALRAKIILILVLAALSVPSFSVSIVHNSEPVVSDMPPVNVSGKILVPLRAIFEELGAAVEWDQSSQTVYAAKGGKTIVLTVGSNTAYVDGNAVLLDQPARLMGDRTFVPVRFVSESLGAFVSWDASTKTVRISDKLYKVIRAVDGDTLEVNFEEKTEKVRLIGIDTPESVHPDKERNTDAGKAAAEHTAEIAEGKLAELEFDVQQRDKYGRLLAYVYIDGEMLNKALLRDGYAVLSTYSPNVKYVEEFRRIARASTALKPLTREEIIADLKANPTEEALKSGIVITETGNRYHLPTCRTVTEGIPITYEKAEEMGYTPCGICIK